MRWSLAFLLGDGRQAKERAGRSNRPSAGATLAKKPSTTTHTLPPSLLRPLPRLARSQFEMNNKRPHSSVYGAPPQPASTPAAAPAVAGPQQPPGTGGAAAAPDYSAAWAAYYQVCFFVSLRSLLSSECSLSLEWEEVTMSCDDDGRKERDD